MAVRLERLISFEKGEGKGKERNFIEVSSRSSAGVLILGFHVTSRRPCLFTEQQQRQSSTTVCIMQNLSAILPLLCTPTWLSHYVSENQEMETM